MLMKCLFILFILFIYFCPHILIFFRQDIAQSPEVKSVLEHKNLFELCKQLAIQQCLQNNESTSNIQITTTIYKWLRAVSPSLYTGPHLDCIYLDNHDFISIWIPFGYIEPSAGTLVCVEQSHTCPQLAQFRSTYGTTKVGNDGTKSGWYTTDPNIINEKVKKNNFFFLK
jgi:hypothetical protein